jgi:hypothetical protein
MLSFLTSKIIEHMSEEDQETFTSNSWWCIRQVKSYSRDFACSTGELCNKTEQISFAIQD